MLWRTEPSTNPPPCGVDASGRADLIRRLFGRAIPLEIIYDDYTVEAPENQILESPRVLWRLGYLDPTSVRAGVSG